MEARDVFHGSALCPYQGTFRCQVWGEFSNKTQARLAEIGLDRQPDPPIETKAPGVKSYLYVCQTYEQGLMALSKAIQLLVN